jgi:cephalosporin hydroxylase
MTPLTIPSAVAVDPNLFADLPRWELANVLGTATHTFFGLTMSQHPQAVVKLNQLLNAVRPARIVEVGCGHAGLTTLFALYCCTTGCELYPYDQQGGKHHALLAQLGYPVLIQDVLTNQTNIDKIKELVAKDGRTLLVADAGKALEFRLYVPSFKVGDMVIMHDFSPTQETFERDIRGKVWNWHEAWYDRVADVCNDCGIIHSPYLNDVVWSLGWKA